MSAGSAGSAGSAASPWGWIAVAPIAAIALAGVVGGASAPLFALALEDANIPRGWIGLNAAIGSVAILLFGAASAPLLRRFGVGPFLCFCLAALALSLIGFKVLDGFFWACVWRFFVGAAFAGLFVGSEYWILSAAARSDQGRSDGEGGRMGWAVAIYTAVLQASFTAGPALLLLTGSRGWPPYLTLAAICALAAIPILLQGDRAPSPPREAGHRGGALAFARATPHFFGAAVLFGLLETGAGSMLVSWGLALQVSETEALTLAAAFAAGGLLFQPLFAYAAERMPPERLMTVAALVCLGGATAALSASALSFPLLLALLFFWGGPTAGLYIAALVAVGRRLEGPALAAANAALVSGYGLGALTGPLAMGVGLQQLGPNGLPLSVMVAALLYLPILARAAARP